MRKEATSADTTLDTGPQMGKITAAVELLSRLYLQKRPPRKGDLPIIQDACLAVEELEAERVKLHEELRSINERLRVILGFMNRMGLEMPKEGQSA